MKIADAALIVMGCLCLWSLAARGESSRARAPQHGRPGRLPPLGSRIYLISEGAEYSPVIITKYSGEPAASGSMRDPLTASQDDAKVPAQPEELAVRQLRKQASGMGKLRFGTLAIAGHRTRPRVEFSRDVLPAERADEPLVRDFFPRVFDPARDNRF